MVENTQECLVISKEKVGMKIGRIFFCLAREFLCFLLSTNFYHVVWIYDALYGWKVDFML